MKNKLPYNVFSNPNDWDKSPRMAEAIAVAITGIAATATGAAAVQLWAATFLVGLGISAVTSWAMAALAGKPKGQDRGLITNIKDAAAPREYVYGEVRKGGVITYIESTGENNKFLHLVLTMAAHEVESITDFYINDEVVPVESGTTYNITYVGSRERGQEGDPEPFTTVYSFSVPTALDYAVSASLTEAQFLEIVEQAYSKEVISGFEYTGNVIFTSATVDAKGTGGGYVTGEKWKGKVRIEAFTGNQTVGAGTLFGESNVLVGTEGAKFIGYNIAYMYIRLEYDGEVFPNGIPVFTAKVRGKKVYDPRTTLTAYSANAALCIRDYLVSEYGMDDAGFTDDTVFASAANVCDEDVDLATAGTQPRYEINGVISAASTPGDILQSMTTACAGTLFWGQGKWQLKPGYYTAPTKTLTLDDLRGPISLSTRISRRDNFNIVRGTFNNKEARYIQEDYPELKSAAFIAEDNGLENALDLTLPLTTDSAMAQRIAKMTLFRGREQMSFTAEFGVNAFDVQVGDIVAFTNDRYGWTAKEFEVLSWDFHSSEDAGDLRVTLTLQETSAAAFSWDGEESEIIGNNTTLPDFSAGLDVSNLQVFEASKVAKDGTFFNAAILSWAKSSNAFVDYYEVEWKVTSDLNYASTSTTGLSVELSPIVDSVEYTFRVRAVTASGVKGTWAEVTLTGGGDLTAPSLPTSIVATGHFKYVTIEWTNPPEVDFNYTEVWENSTNTTVGATKVGTSSGNTFQRTNLGIQETKWYFLRSVDYSGNISDYTSGVSATTTFIDDDDFANGIYTLFTEQGLYAIEDFATLPASGDFLEQKVYNRADGKLYSWNGTAWVLVVAAVEAPDISGQLQTAQIAVDAITNDLIANDAVQAENISNLAITADKIATNAVTVDKVVSGAITSAKLADGAATSVKIASDAITETKISSGAITTPKIAAGAVIASTIAANAITAGKIDTNAVTAGTIAAGAVTAGTISANAVTATEIAADSITTSKIAAGAITATEIASNSITSSKIAAGAITATKIASNSITSAKIVAGTIQASDIQSGTITGTQISGNTITGNKIVANTITGGLLSTSGIITNSAQITNSVITNAKIQNAAITTLKIGGNAVTVPMSVTENINRSGGLSNAEVQSLELILDEAGDVLVTWSGAQGYSGYSSHTTELRVNGAGQMSRGGDATNDMPNLAWSAPLSAGTHTIAIWWVGGNSSITLSNGTLTAFGVKR